MQHLPFDGPQGRIRMAQADAYPLDLALARRPESCLGGFVYDPNKPLNALVLRDPTGAKPLQVREVVALCAFRVRCS